MLIIPIRCRRECPCILSQELHECFPFPPGSIATYLRVFSACPAMCLYNLVQAGCKVRNCVAPTSSSLLPIRAELAPCVYRTGKNRRCILGPPSMHTKGNRPYTPSFAPTNPHVRSHTDLPRHFPVNSLLEPRPTANAWNGYLIN